MSVNDEPVVWVGDLDDECSAEFSGLLLRAEQVESNQWWWAVLLADTQVLVADSNSSPDWATTGKRAREAAEAAARNFLRHN